MARKYLWTGLILALLVYFGSACKPNPSEVVIESESPRSIQMTSSAFADGEFIPARYACDGENLSPPLTWSGIPQNAKSMALIMDDPDAPAGTWVHWVTYDLPPNLEGLDEGAREIGVEGVNSWNNTGYGGPCPPLGNLHRYYFKLYALDTELYLQSGTPKADIEKAMQGHILAEGRLMGKYQR